MSINPSYARAIRWLIALLVALTAVTLVINHQENKQPAEDKKFYGPNSAAFVVADTATDTSQKDCSWPDRPFADGSVWDRIRNKEQSTLPGWFDHRFEPCYFNWDTNRCSFSPDSPFGWPFWKGCIRHDFHYRNLIKMEQVYNQNFWTVHNESVADVDLFKDLKWVCSDENAGPNCVDTAYTYYKAVCQAGASNCCPGRPDIYNDGHCYWQWNEFEVKVWVKQKAGAR